MMIDRAEALAGQFGGRAYACIVKQNRFNPPVIAADAIRSFATKRNRDSRIAVGGRG